MEGDKNTLFFFAQVSIRKRTNHVDVLQISNGRWASNKEGMSCLVMDYFQDLFSDSLGTYDPIIS